MPFLNEPEKSNLGHRTNVVLGWIAILMLLGAGCLLLWIGGNFK